MEGASFSPDGRRVVTAGDDGVVRVWAAGTGEPIATYASEGGAARWAFLAPDGPFVVTEGEGGVRIDRCDICDCG